MMVLAISAYQHHFCWQVCYSHFKSMYALVSSTAVKSVFGLCCHLFAGLVDFLLQAAHWLTMSPQHLSGNTTNRNAQCKNKSLKKGCCCFLSHTSRIALGVIHFKDLYGYSFMPSECISYFPHGMSSEDILGHLDNLFTCKDSRLTSGFFRVQRA